MLEEQASERDLRLMDEVLRAARTDLAHGGAGVAALLASPDQIIAGAHNTIQETGDLTNHAEMVLLHGMGRELPEMDERATRAAMCRREPVRSCV